MRGLSLNSQSLRIGRDSTRSTSKTERYRKLSSQVEETLIGAASAIIGIALVTILVKPLAANGAVPARTEMFLTAFLLTQKTLATKAQIKIDPNHFAKAIALAAIVGYVSRKFKGTLIPLATSLVTFEETSVWRLNRCCLSCYLEFRIGLRSSGS